MKRLTLVLAIALVAVAGCTSQPASIATPVPPTSTPQSVSAASPIPPTSTPQPTPPVTPVPPTSTATALAATPAATYTVRVTKDVEYTRPLQPEVHTQKLDVYAPEQTGPWPVVIFVPGYGADKGTMADVLYGKELARRGAVVILPDWRASMARESVKNDGALWREALEELSCAVRFARAGAADYGGDPEWVTVVGGRSIGESLVQALVGDDSEAWDRFAAARGGPPAQAECLASEGSAQVNAYVAWGEDPNEMDFLKDQDPELWKLCNPTANLGRNPSLKVRFVRGAEDQRTRPERITAFQQAMKDAGYDVTLTALAEGDDAPPWSGPAFEAFIQAILEATEPTLTPVPLAPTRTPLPPPISSDFPTGTFFHKHPATFCVYQFNEDGTWAYFWKVLSVDVNGREPFLRGTYSVDGNLYTDTTVGDPDCPWPATYTWTFDGQTLTFQVVGEDKCAERQRTYEAPLLWTKLE